MGIYLADYAPDDDESAKIHGIDFGIGPHEAGAGWLASEK
jgi:hypothetical protein